MTVNNEEAGDFLSKPRWSAGRKRSSYLGGVPMFLSSLVRGGVALLEGAVDQEWHGPIRI
jgi:hypothetical protein